MLLGVWVVVGLVCVSGSSVITVEPFGDHSVRVRVSAPGQPVQEPLIGALLPKAPLTSTDVTSRSPLDVTNGNLRVSVDPTSGLLTATRVSDSTVVLKQTGLMWGDASPHTRPGSRSVVVTFQGTTGERVYGLGEHRTGRVQQAPYHKVFADSLFYGKSRGSDVSVPYYSSSRGYGFLWNLPSLGSVSITEESIIWVSNATKGVDLWITVAPKGVPASSSYPDLLRHYTAAVGRALPMPFWSTGFIQCKDRYRNQTQLLDVARGYVSRGLPISMIVIDWFHWKEMGDWSFNPACWPDPQQMVDDLRGMGIEPMVTFWPFVGQNVSTHWEEYRDHKYLAVSQSDGKPDSFWRYNTPTGNAVVDATNPAAMNATFRHWYEGYGKYGIRALWMDEAEPDHSRYISGGQWDFHLGTDAEILPAWVSAWTKGISDGMETIGTGPGDFFILSRNAWSNTPAHGTALWSGDISSTFGELAMQVTVLQGVAMSGIPLWTTDIGGYAGGDPSDPTFQQLIVRWFQFGAFCPLFRLHGHRKGGPPPTPQCWATNGDNEVWNLAKDAAHYDAIVAVMRLREDLRQYVAQLNAETVATGMPMARPMVLQFPDDAVCNQDKAEDQFMLGPDWLVSPVTSENATSWIVYLPHLPEGHKGEWVYWWNQTTAPQGQWVTVNTVAIRDFPLFYRRPV